MGVTAAVVGFPQAVDRRPVVVQTDEHLVARVRAGDDAAFEAVYDRYARGVLAFCVHMLGSRESAEDALQLTFVSAYRALRGGESNISLRPWLYTIARNRCLSELRTRRDAVDVDVIAVDRPCFEGLADQVQRREELREMVEDIQRLPADQRAALVLFELGDHSHKEIAAVLGVRVEKVKALIFQAREALVRSRQARERPCAEIRERLATLHGKVLPRSTMRAHIDRCPGCAAFEDEVRRQRAALALILPVALTGELKASVLGAALGGGGAVAAGAGTAGAGACGSGAVVAGGATAAGGVGGAGGVVAGGATAAGGAGAVAAGASAAGSVAAGTGAASTAVIAGGPSVAAVATGLTAVGADYAASVGVGGLGATGVLAKILTAAAIATGAAGAIHASSHAPHPLPGPAAALQLQTTSAWPATAPTIASNPAATTPAATPSAATATTSAPTATPSAATATPSAPTATPSAATATPSAPTATPSAATATTSAPTATPSAATATTSAPTATPSAATATTSAPTATPSAATATTSAPAATPSAATATTSAPTATPSAATATTSAPTATPSAATATPSAATATRAPRPRRRAPPPPRRAPPPPQPPRHPAPPARPPPQTTRPQPPTPCRIRRLLERRSTLSPLRRQPAAEPIDAITAPVPSMRGRPSPGFLVARAPISRRSRAAVGLSARAGSSTRMRQSFPTGANGPAASRDRLLCRTTSRDQRCSLGQGVNEAAAAASLLAGIAGRQRRSSLVHEG